MSEEDRLILRDLEAQLERVCDTRYPLYKSISEHKRAIAALEKELDVIDIEVERLSWEVAAARSKNNVDNRQWTFCRECKRIIHASNNPLERNPHCDDSGWGPAVYRCY